MPETLQKTERTNDFRSDKQRHIFEITELILQELAENKRVPTPKELSIATGLHVQTIYLLFKDINLGDLRTQSRIYGPAILSRQAKRALSSGDHNEAKTYFKLNYDWAEREEKTIKGEITFVGKTVSEMSHEERKALEARLLANPDSFTRDAEGRVVEAEFEQAHETVSSGIT